MQMQIPSSLFGECRGGEKNTAFNWNLCLNAEQCATMWDMYHAFWRGTPEITRITRCCYATIKCASQWCNANSASSLRWNCFPPDKKHELDSILRDGIYRSIRKMRFPRKQIDRVQIRFPPRIANALSFYRKYFLVENNKTYGNCAPLLLSISKIFRMSSTYSEILV